VPLDEPEGRIGPPGFFDVPHSDGTRYSKEWSPPPMAMTLEQQTHIPTRQDLSVPSGSGQRAAVAALPALLIEHLSKRFVVGSRKKRKTVNAINDVSLRIERGEIYGVLGANGSGKSTLIRLVSTLLTPDEGRVEVFGHDITRDEMAVKRLINRVSVDAAFFKKLSPYENLIYAARLYGVDAGHARREMIRILGRLGIGQARIGRPLEQMSRGMQQKVAIARAFLTSPVLLLLDEPTTGLDPRSKLEVQTFVEEIRDEHDATIVLTTHDLDEAERLCSRIGLLNDGRLVAEGTVDELKAGIAAGRAADDGPATSLHDVFMIHTGRSLDEDFEEPGQDDE
jgi:ABC-2 type transport system ATP-binding protein